MYEAIKKKFNDLEKDLSDPKIVSNPKKLAEISRQHAEMKETAGLVLELEKISDRIEENKKIIKQEEGGELKEMAEEELAELEKKYENLKNEIEIKLKPVDPRDKKNVIMEIRAGTGGDESALFAADLFRMYSRFSERQGWKVGILNSNRIGIGGFKEIIFEIKGKDVFGSLKYEGGTHRVQRVPETEKQGRIHTSTATVAVLAEAEEVDLAINPNDIRIDTFCSSGPGGQSVNTTYSAVRVLHLPTGLIVQCQDQKSQHQNKEKALQILRSRLFEKAEEEKRERDSAERKQQFGHGERSDKIRTYNFPQDRLTDHRLQKSWHSLSRIMDGEIDDIIKELRIKL
ncbi:MAG: peptide chain release factor 1 [Patescibacteria group bacterium]|nr:peptide chain release factor 1 [Patescibacteria group bacterium]